MLNNLVSVNFIILMVLAAILGLIIGSFLNVLIYRIPLMLEEELRGESSKFNLALPGSHCPQCKYPIPWHYNIPLISYIALRGKCSNCRIKISLRYPLVELISCLTTLVLTSYFGVSVKTILLLLLTWGLICIVFIDLDHKIIPDTLSLPLLWLGLLFNTTPQGLVSPSVAVIGAAAGYLSLFCIAKIFKIIRKMDGMGNGDFKLLALFGAWFGWQILPTTVLFASLAGTAVGLYLIITKKMRFTEPLPFGPYLALAGWLNLFFHGY
jgi:leader peptidase (prepilin peptidase)/N-methyltransferase